MTTIEAVRHLLSSVLTDALCDDCLAAACAATVDDMRAATEKLVASDPAFHRGSSCASCRRTVPTIFYRVDTDARGGHVERITPTRI